MRDGDIVLLCDRHTDEDQNVLFRMRFHDIEADSFTWSWERSDDGGASFALSWRIDYRREPG